MATATKAEKWVVKTGIDNILCETGERHAALFVGGITGYKPKVFVRRSAAEKRAAELTSVGGRVVRYEDAWTKGC